MPNDELLTAIRLEIREALRIDREETIKRTLERFGLDMSKNDDWISQHQADRLIGKAQRIKGKENGTIRYKDSEPGRYDRVYLSREDVMRIKNSVKFRTRNKAN